MWWVCVCLFIFLFFALSFSFFWSYSIITFCFHWRKINQWIVRFQFIIKSRQSNEHRLQHQCTREAHICVRRCVGFGVALWSRFHVKICLQTDEFEVFIHSISIYCRRFMRSFILSILLSLIDRYTQIHTISKLNTPTINNVTGLLLYKRFKNHRYENFAYVRYILCSISLLNRKQNE